ncbi:MAG: SPASM domain-containing protein [Candidatus Lokiarchaeota archaeon]
MSYTIQIKKGQHIFLEPNYVIVEPHKGCTRKCEFCGIRFEDGHHDMELVTFKKIVSELTPKTKKLTFIQHGEPLLNENLEDMICVALNKLPKIQIGIVTNADILTRKHKSIKYLMELYTSGLDIAIVDLYDVQSKELFKELVKSQSTFFKYNHIKIVDFYSSGIDIWTYHNKRKYMVICDDSKQFNSDGSNKRCLHTWAGNLDYRVFLKYGIDINIFPVLKPCVDPYKHMAIGFEGNVHLCCSEGSEDSKLGNILIDGLMNIWTSEKFQMYRYALKLGRRDIIPSCYLCPKPSFRFGLYPYWGERTYNVAELSKFFCDNSKMRGNLLSNLKYYDEIIGLNNPNIKRKIYE